MREKIELTGIVLSSMVVGDYDKRLVILTKERGKIIAFAKGARKSNSPYLGMSEPFNCGTFTLLEGFDAYRLVGAEIKEYFLNIKNNIESICYGTYFCDVLEYLCVEGIGDVQVLNLLYISLKALMKDEVPNPLVRRIFELRILALDGEALSAFTCVKCNEKNLFAFYLKGNGLICKDCFHELSLGKELLESSIYTLQYILSSPLNKLYCFKVTDEVFQEIDKVIDQYFKQHISRKFNSLTILDSLS